MVLVEDVEILPTVKFLWILFRGEVENVSANQRPEKTQTWYRTLRSCFLSSFLEFRWAVSEEKLKMSQSIRGRGGYLFFLRSARKKHKVGRGRLDLASCQVSLNSVQRFQRSRKCEKLTTTDDGQQCTWAFGSGALKTLVACFEVMVVQELYKKPVLKH